MRRYRGLLGVVSLLILLAFCSWWWMKLPVSKRHAPVFQLLPVSIPIGHSNWLTISDGGVYVVRETVVGQTFCWAVEKKPSAHTKGRDTSVHSVHPNSRSRPIQLGIQKRYELREVISW